MNLFPPNSHARKYKTWRSIVNKKIFDLTNKDHFKEIKSIFCEICGKSTPTKLLNRNLAHKGKCFACFGCRYDFAQKYSNVIRNDTRITKQMCMENYIIPEHILGLLTPLRKKYYYYTLLYLQWEVSILAFAYHGGYLQNAMTDREDKRIKRRERLHNAGWGPIWRPVREENELKF